MRPTHVKLYNWSVQTSNPYAAPEQGARSLKGRVEGHPNFDDGDKVRTSRVVSSKGRLVTTSSGRTYRLGRICPKYRAWLKKEAIPYDPQAPFKVCR